MKKKIICVLIIAVLLCSILTVIIMINRTDSLSELVSDLYRDITYDEEYILRYEEPEAEKYPLDLYNYFAAMHNDDMYCLREFMDDNTQLEYKLEDMYLQFNINPFLGACYRTYGYYKIKNVSTEYAVAAKIEDYYFIYINIYYEPDSLEEYVKDTGLLSGMEDTRVHVSYDDGEEIHKYVYVDDAKEKVIDYLMNEDREAVRDNGGNVHERAEENNAVSIYCYNSITKDRVLFGHTSSGNIYVKKNGYCNPWGVFESDYDEIEEFIEYFIDNVKGYKYIIW